MSVNSFVEKFSTPNGHGFLERVYSSASLDTAHLVPTTKKSFAMIADVFSFPTNRDDSTAF